MTALPTMPVRSSSPRSWWRRRRWRWAILGAVGGMSLAAGLYFLVTYLSERDLREALAEADRLDPGWRIEDIEAARENVPDAENGASVVLAAGALLPKNWRAGLDPNSTGVEDRLAKLPPTDRPLDTDLLQVRTELDKIGPAIDKARELADLPRGRYRVAWSADHIGTIVPHTEHVHELARILTLDALVRSEDGDPEGAVRSCQAALNVARSFGDEPLAISQHLRAICALEGVHALERALASGTVHAKTLQDLLRLLADEAEQPLLLRMARSNRHAYFQPMEMMRTHKFDRSVYKVRSPILLGHKGADFLDSRTAQASEAVYLRWTTTLVEAAKLPAQEQEERFRDLPKPTEKLPWLLDALYQGDGTNWVKYARKFNRIRAELRCASAALAAERYRLAEGKWPANLEAVVPKYLPAVPLDPFDGQPLRLCRTANGIVVYSIGPDRTDNAGHLDRMNPGDAGTDLGFELWDADRRLTPPRELDR